MLPASRLARTVITDLVSVAVAINGLPGRHNARVRDPWTGSARPTIIRPSYHVRTLFELHTGRQAPEIARGLPLKEVWGPSNAQTDVATFATSKNLIVALGALGQEYAIPSQYQTKLDQSYVDPLLVALDLEKAQQEASEKEKLALETKKLVTLKSILTQYLRHVHPILEDQSLLGQSALQYRQLNFPLSKIFTSHALKCLRRLGPWNVTDVMDWAWILTADSPERAAIRLTIVNRIALDTIGKPVPPFVFLFLLRRQNTSAKALRPLLIYAWQLLKRSERHSETVAQGNSAEEKKIEETRIAHPREDSLGMGENIFIIMIVRLLRHARKVWPAACESITAMLCQYLDGSNFRIKFQSSKTPAGDAHDEARLPFAYNTILRLLAVPASMHPFQSATHQQRAQFKVLRRMNAFDPPLVVDRRGYQAVLKMQLMHKKTMKEREWAHMKAKSWPPWKEVKLRIDADIGPERGISRAKEVLRRAKEAGYANGGLEDVAEVLSGWDTDGSPTIQTRAIFAPLGRNESGRKKEARLWMARIKATRTLDEAWACFLAYKDQTQDAWHEVYYAMFDKLFMNRKRTSTEVHRELVFADPQAEALLPGDVPEVFPPPDYRRDATYVRTPPPDIDDFFQSMLNRGTKPRGRFLAMLLKNASSLDCGIGYLQASQMPLRYVSALSGRNAVRTKDWQLALREIPDYLFAAFIDLLARSSPNNSVKDANAQEDLKNRPDIPGPFNPPFLDPLSHALQLMRDRASKYRPAWYSILSALARAGAVTHLDSNRPGQRREERFPWHIMCSITDRMQKLGVTFDLDGFRILCTGFEKTLFALEIVQARHGKHTSPFVKKIRQSMVLQGLPLLKGMFKDLVTSDSMQEDVPEALKKEKTDIDRGSEEMSMSEIGEGSAGEGTVEEESSVDADVKDSDSPKKTTAFLPPACLLPKLLEVPRPAQLHAFIRILGLRRDYQGLLDLIEWIALHAEDIREVTNEARNGHRMMRRCLIATRVFLERSWTYYEDAEGEGNGLAEDDVEPAPVEIWQVVHDTVLENTHWGGWPTDEEVGSYCMNGRFL